MDEFHKTRMGQIFYERTLPALVQSINANTEVLKRLAEAQEKANQLAAEEAERKKPVWIGPR